MQNHLQTVADSDGVSVHSGFPNPALDAGRQGGALALNLNQLLIHRPSSTFLFRVVGHQWAEQNIYDGDIIVVDRAAAARRHGLVIAWQTEHFSIHRQANLPPSTQPWGLITAVIHQL